MGTMAVVVGEKAGPYIHEIPPPPPVVSRGDDGSREQARQGEEDRRQEDGVCEGHGRASDDGHGCIVDGLLTPGRHMKRRRYT